MQLLCAPQREILVISRLHAWPGRSAPSAIRMWRMNVAGATQIENFLIRTSSINYVLPFFHKHRNTTEHNSDEYSSATTGRYERPASQFRIDASSCTSCTSCTRLHTLVRSNISLKCDAISSLQPPLSARVPCRRFSRPNPRNPSLTSYSPAKFPFVLLCSVRCLDHSNADSSSVSPPFDLPSLRYHRLRPESLLNIQ